MLTLNSSLFIKYLVSLVKFLLLVKSMGITVVKILNQNDCTVLPFVSSALSEGVRKIVKYLTIFDYPVFLCRDGTKISRSILKKKWCESAW